MALTFQKHDLEAERRRMLQLEERLKAIATGHPGPHLRAWVQPLGDRWDVRIWREEGQAAVFDALAQRLHDEEQVVAAFERWASAGYP